MPIFPFQRPLALPVVALRPAWLLLCCWLAGAASADVLKIEIDGVKGDLKRNLLAHLAAVQGDELDKLSSGRIRAMHRQAPAALEEALAPSGSDAAVVGLSLAYALKATVFSFFKV